MIQARNIHKTFGSLEVLKGIDIDIEPGRVTAIVGPSGAGKTTLLQILGTLSSADVVGVLRYDGVDLTALSDSKLSRFRNSNIGFVFQFHRLLPEFTLIENVAMPALIGGASRQEAFAKARALLGRLHLEGRDSHRPSELSGGECQRGPCACQRPEDSLCRRAFGQPRPSEPCRASPPLLPPARRAWCHIRHRDARRQSCRRCRHSGAHGRRQDNINH